MLGAGKAAEETVRKLEPNINAALGWIERNSQTSFKTPGKLGFLRIDKSLINHGWKDSGDSSKHIIGADGVVHDPKFPSFIC